MPEITQTAEMIPAEKPLMIVGLNANDVYKMVYKDRSNIKTIHFQYICKVDESQYKDIESGKRIAAIARARLQKAIERSKKYCENCRFRFIHCELFLVDLDEAERVASESY